MTYELPEPRYEHRCTLIGNDGKVCGRTLGPYYERGPLVAAIAAHKAAQHVKALPKLQETDSADARMKAASGRSPGYEPPMTRARRK